MRHAATFCVWSAVLTGAIAFAIIASVLALMAMSLDPAQMIAAGIEPWTDALFAVLAAVVSILTGAVALRLWHSRYWAAGLLLVFAVIGGAAWACTWVAREYF